MASESSRASSEREGMMKKLVDNEKSSARMRRLNCRESWSWSASRAGHRDIIFSQSVSNDAIVLIHGKIGDREQLGDEQIDLVVQALAGVMIGAGS